MDFGYFKEYFEYTSESLEELNIIVVRNESNSTFKNNYLYKSFNKIRCFFSTTVAAFVFPDGIVGIIEASAILIFLFHLF